VLSAEVSLPEVLEMHQLEILNLCEMSFLNCTESLIGFCGDSRENSAVLEVLDGDSKSVQASVGTTPRTAQWANR